MKKTLSVILVFVIVLSFTACGQQVQKDITNEFDIDSQEWTMTIIQSQSKEEKGEIVAYGSNSNISEQAIKIDMVITAEDGQFTLNDKTNSKIYSGKYNLNSKSAISTTYDIFIGDIKGMAVVSCTKYNDDSQVDTLILSFDDYALSFLGKNK